YQSVKQVGQGRRYPAAADVCEGSQRSALGVPALPAREETKQSEKGPEALAHDRRYFIEGITAHPARSGFNPGSRAVCPVRASVITEENRQGQDLQFARTAGVLCGQRQGSQTIRIRRQSLGSVD